MENYNLNDDPFAEASNSKMPDFEYFGQLKIKAWWGVFPKEGGAPVEFDPKQHNLNERQGMVDIAIACISQQDTRFPPHASYVMTSADWNKITKPSIQAMGFENVREINDKWVRVAQVDGFKKRKDKPGEFYKTLKVLEVYSSEQACIAAYMGDSQYTEPVSSQSDKQSALSVLRVMVAEAGAVTKVKPAVQAIVAEKIQKNELVSRNFNAESPEVQELILAAVGA